MLQLGFIFFHYYRYMLNFLTHKSFIYGYQT